MIRESISNVGLIEFETARIEMIADQKPLEPKLPWLGTVVGLVLACAGIATLVS